MYKTIVFYIVLDEKTFINLKTSKWCKFKLSWFKIICQLHRKRSRGSVSISCSKHLETWLSKNTQKGMTIHNMSRKQINIPKVMRFSWMKDHKILEARNILKLQKLQKFFPLLEKCWILTEISDRF